MFTGVSSVKGLFEDRLQTFAHFRVVEWLLGSERGFQERRKLKLKLPGVEKIGLKAAWNRKYWLRKVGKRVYSRRTAKETSYTVHEMWGGKLVTSSSWGTDCRKTRVNHAPRIEILRM